MKYKLLIISNFLILVLILFSNQVLFSQRWERVNIPQQFSGVEFLDIYFLPSNPNYGWSCGFQGTVLRTTDGGQTWQGTRINGADHLESIHFPGPTIGYASGQEGVFKSTDGGQSWTEITPSSNTINLWGCYFVDDNNGFVIGGGCTDPQHFWRTTDGGKNWTVYTANEPNTGLTDLIVYNMNGLGYASSSGWIWQTTNGGVTWSKYSNTGTHDWQEEISKAGNSFLVPFATSCGGGGSSGGMRFSDDNGASWKNYNTGTRMFGAFLLNSTTGWVVGDSRNVWYTSDAGDTWELRNCGLGTGNYDDIWFISPTNGWIAGYGIYKLSPPLQTANKNELIYGDVCIPNWQEQQVIVENISFNPDNVSIVILNDALNEFSIQSPGTYFSLNSCESQRITVRFTPKDIGLRQATLQIRFDYGTVINVSLTGYGAKRTVVPEDSLLIINPAFCNKQNYASLNWTAETDNESIRYIDYLGGATNIYSLSTTPFKINSSGSATLFLAIPIDTGWISTRFKVDFIPCMDDTVITVNAYGVSPIITSKQSMTFSQQCNDEVIDTLSVYNTGNAELIISNATIFESNTNFEIIGWEGILNYPFLIPVDSLSNLIIRYRYNPSKSDTATLSIINNDSTTIRGSKNPYIVKLYGEFGESKLYSKDSVFNFDNVCIGAEKKISFFIYNIGDLPLQLFETTDTTKFSVIIDAVSTPVNLKKNDSVRVTMTFRPKSIGFFDDTITFFAEPCSRKLKLYVSGTGINAKIQIVPDNISLSLQTNKTQKFQVQVLSSGTEALNVINFDITPSNSFLSYSITPSLPQSISANDVIDFELDITSSIDTVFDGFLCFSATGNCDAGACVPIHIESNSSNLYLSDYSINFGLHTCIAPNLTDTVYILNDGFIPDTVSKIDLNPQNEGFSILYPLSFPLEIKPGDSIPLIINFNTGSEGSHSATISLYSYYRGNNSLNVDLSVEFRKVETKPNYRTIDFSDIEQCDIPYQREITLFNSGTLRDSIIIRQTDTRFTIVPNNYVIVDALDSAKLTIILDPMKFDIGTINENVILESQICYELDTINIFANIYHPFLTYKPDTIKFIEPWFDENNYSSLTIYNLSGYRKNISSIDIDDNTYFNIVNNLNFPYTMLPDDSLKFTISFYSKEEKLHQAVLKVVEESICVDTVLIPLEANIEPINFGTNVSIGNYQAKPDEVIDLKITIDRALSQLRHKGIKYQISFDPYLFYPTNIIVKNGQQTMTAPFGNYQSGVLTGFLDTTYSKDMLKTSGEIMTIRGLVLYSYPDSTILSIDEFEPISSRNIMINKINGSLVARPVCKPIASMRLMKINPPLIKLVEDPISDGKIEISIDVERRIEGKLYLTDIRGVDLINQDLYLNYGNNEINLFTSDLVSGIYFLRFQIAGYIFVEKIIILN